MPHLEPPEDSNITTLYCGGLDDTVTEQDIKNAFYAFGEIRNITLVTKQVNRTGRGAVEHADDDVGENGDEIGLGNGVAITDEYGITLTDDDCVAITDDNGITLTDAVLQGCAFVQFTQRKSAEKAAEGTFNKLLVRGNKITIRYLEASFNKNLQMDSFGKKRRLPLI